MYRIPTKTNQIIQEFVSKVNDLLGDRIKK